MTNADTLTTWLESGVGEVQDWNNLKGEWSLSSQDVSQRLVLSYIYDLPFGHGQKYLRGCWQRHREGDFRMGRPRYHDVSEGLPLADKLWGLDGAVTGESGNRDLAPECCAGMLQGYGARSFDGGNCLVQPGLLHCSQRLWFRERVARGSYASRPRD